MLRSSIVELKPDEITIALIRQRMGRRDLCRKCGISESNFSSMMRRGYVRTVTAGRIADALGVDYLQIIKLPNEMKGEENNDP